MTTYKSLVKSRELLVKALLPRQRKQLKKYGWFNAMGSAGGRYKIVCNAYELNIYRYSRALVREMYCNYIDCDAGPEQIWVCYCLHVANKHRVPLYDHLLAQKFIIETDEWRFLNLCEQDYIAHRTATIEKEGHEALQYLAMNARQYKKICLNSMVILGA